MFLLILIRVSYLLEWQIFSGNIILAEVEVQRQNVTGFELSVWGTSTKKRKEIEENTKYFWKWLNNISTDKTSYYMAVRLKLS